MRTILFTLCCLISILVQAQDTTRVNSVWNEGSQWDVYYTVEGEGSDTLGSQVKVTYRMLPAQDHYLALEKTVTIDDVIESIQVQGYIRADGDTVIYVRPVLEDGSIGDECLLYDFRVPYEYGSTIKYGVMGGNVKEIYIDWDKDSLDYYMLNDGDMHCLPAWQGIIYKYGYIGGPMSLFLLEAAPGKASQPKPSNISHVIFSTKGGHKKYRMNGTEGEDDIIIPYDEMLTDGTTWQCLAVSTEQPDNRHTYTIQVAGDTLIGEHRCKQVYSPEHQVRMVMFEEARKVYVIDSDDNPSVLLDFNLLEGDLIDEVASVMSVNIQVNQGYPYRTITIDSGLDCQSYFAGDTEPWTYHLIEGIGVSKDQYLEGQRFLSMENAFSYLLRCWKNGTLVYQAPGYETITGVNEVQHESNQWLPIYDLQGHRLNSIPQKGIYIIGNKKIISR